MLSKHIAVFTLPSALFLTGASPAQATIVTSTTRSGANTILRVMGHFNYPGAQLESVLLAAIHDSQGLKKAAALPPGKPATISLARRRLAWRARVLALALINKIPDVKMIQAIPSHASFADAQFLMLITPHLPPRETKALRERLSKIQMDRGRILLGIYAPLLR